MIICFPLQVWHLVFIWIMWMVCERSWITALYLLMIFFSFFGHSRVQMVGGKRFWPSYVICFFFLFFFKFLCCVAVVILCWRIAWCCSSGLLAATRGTELTRKFKGIKGNEQKGQENKWSWTTDLNEAGDKKIVLHYLYSDTIFFSSFNPILPWQMLSW